MKINHDEEIQTI